MRRWRSALPQCMGVVLPLLLCLAGCTPGGDNGQPTAPSSPSPVVERQALGNLLALYQEAVEAEDSDRLAALLAPIDGQAQPAASVLRQDSAGALANLAAFQATMSALFRQTTVTALSIPPDTVEVAPDQGSVTFLEVVSRLDPGTLTQITQVYRTTWQVRRLTTASTTALGIGAVQRDGPLVAITTPGQVQAGALTRVQVTTPDSGWSLTRVELATPDSAAAPLLDTPQGFYGAFRAALAPPATLKLRLHRSSGEALLLAHPYRPRMASEGVVQPVAGTPATPMRAVALAPDGTVWAGGEAGGRLVRLAPGATRAEAVGQLLADPAGRIEDLSIDGLGRLQAVVFAPQHSGVLVRDGTGFCQTVNVVDPAYPLRTAGGQPSPGTRAVAAGAEAIWLHGSDAGIVRVRDGFRGGQCPAAGVAVHYDSVLRREDGTLPANTVPALLVARDGALWIGSALGLSRLQQGQATRVPFDAALSFRGNSATLEAFFQEVAQAIFAARPLTTVALGSVSFVAAFGSPLLKADLIFSLAEDLQGRMWAGTLGGGLRRLEVRNWAVQDTLHLRRQDGLASNIIFALAVGPDGSLWAATDDGVSRLVDVGGLVNITNFGALEGLGLPARDVAVDTQGTAWVATDGGLFRIDAQGGELSGVVHDVTGTPVANADVLLLGTALRTVTEADGGFVLRQVPPGAYLLQADASLAGDGALTTGFREVLVARAAQRLAPLRLGASVGFDPAQGGQVRFTTVPGAALEVPPGATTLPPATTPALGLVLRPLSALPRPVPIGFTAVAAVELSPADLRFSQPARLTLPLPMPLPPGQLGILLHFNTATQAYAQVGLGRVSSDGTTMTTLSGGLRQLSTVVFATTGVQATKVFLVPVAGNNQRVQPGEVLPEPLVVRLEDQFGNPVVGEAVAARINRGEGAIVAADTVTNTQGEARVTVRAGISDADLVVAVGAPALPVVRPAQFVAIVGMFDTPGNALDLVVAGDVVFVADGITGGLQVLDVQNPSRPVRLHNPLLARLGTLGVAFSLAWRGERLYVGSNGFENLHIFDISQVRTPDFTADRNGNGVPDVLLGTVALPTGQIPRSLAVAGQLVYAATENQAAGTLQVIDVTTDTQPRVLGVLTLPIPNPTGLAVVGEVVYIGAREEGLLVVDVHASTAPRLLGAVGDSDPAAALAMSVIAGPVVADGFAYFVEQQREPQTGQVTESLVVLDVQRPLAPVRRGAVPLRGVTRERTTTVVIGGTRLAVAGPFVYISRGELGVQVIDRSQPETPRLVGVIPTPTVVRSVAAGGQVLYITDAIFGLQIIRGPGPDEPDTDGDGIIDVFDAFPTDPTEWQDTDGDRMGDNADPDDDNDGFTDTEEAAAIPPTDPLDLRRYPVTAPPPGVTTLLVDASSTVPVKARNGTPAAPYRSLTEALQVLHTGQAHQIHILHLRPGRYAPSTTQEAFPLDVHGLAHFTLQGAGRATTVLDAEFHDEALVITDSHDLFVEEITVTHGVQGLVVSDSRDIVIRRIESRANHEFGIRVLDATGVLIQENLAEFNGGPGGISVRNSEAVVTQNVSRANNTYGIQAIVGSRADIRDNVSERNGDIGIIVSQDSHATITNNLIQDNGLDGINVISDSSATITNNLTQNNGRRGIQISRNSSAMASHNVIQHNANDGILVNDHSSATLTDNLIQHNGQPTSRFGISVSTLSTTVLRHNTVTHSGSHGINIVGTSEATISGGSSSQNTRDGIRVGGGTTLPGRSTAAIGLDDAALLELSENGGAGLFVVTDGFGSEARIDSRQIVFSGNAGGAITGSVVDVAVGP